MRSVVISKCLHLKSAASLVGDGVLLANPEWVDLSEFETLEIIAVDPSEAHAANALRVGNSVIYPASFPRSAERLERHGLDLVPVDVSELQKAEGGVSCCSLVFDNRPPTGTSH